MIWAFVAVALAGTFTDVTGTLVTAEPTDRIVVVSGGLTESVFALGGGARVVAVDATSTWPPEVGALPQVGFYRQLSAEGVLSVGPDLVIVPDDAGPPGVVDQLRAAGVEVAVLPSAHTVDGARERLRGLGALLDAEERAASLVQSLDQGLAAIQPAGDRPRVLFVYARGAGTLQVAGRDTAADAMIQLAGGINAVQAWSGFRPLTAEALVAARPDVLLFTDNGLASVGGVDGVLAQPGVRATPAGASRRIVAVDDHLLLAFGPRLAEGVALLARRLE